MIARRRGGLIALAASIALGAALATCTQEPAGPARRAALSVAPVLPRGMDLAAFNLTVDNVRLIVVRPAADTVVDKIFAFPANQSTLTISSDVTLEQSPETFQVTIQLLSGATLLFEGTQAVALTAGTTAQPAAIPVTYSGPGQNVATLTIDPPDSVLSFGGLLTFRPAAQDAQGAPVASFYVSWATSGPVTVPIDATGTLIAPATRAIVTVTATTPTGITASTPITFVPPPNAVTVVSGCPQSGSPGQQLPQPLLVQVDGADNLGVRGVRVQFSAASGGGAVSPASDTTDAQGRAQTLLTLGPGGGANVFEATVSGVATAAICNATALGATQLAYRSQPASAVAGASLGTIDVELRDANGALVTTATNAVTLAIGNNPGGGTLSGTATVNAAGGVATFTGLSIDKAGTGYTLVASAAGMTAAASTPFDVTAGAATQLVFTQQPPASVVAGTGFTIVVAAQDAHGNTDPTFTANVTLALGTRPAGAVLSGATTVVAASGVATFDALAPLTEAGGYTLVASSPGLQNVASGSFTLTPAAAAVLAFVTQPTAVATGAVITPAVQVAVQDVFANVVTTATNPVTLFLAVPNGATLGGVTTQNAASGVATFTGLTVDKPGTYTLTAAASGLTADTSVSFVVAVVMNAWANGAGGAWSVASNWSQGRAPAATDSVVIALAGTYTVSLDTTVSVGFLTFGAASGVQTVSMSSRTLTVTGAVTVQSGAAAAISNGTLADQAGMTNLGRLTLTTGTMGDLLNAGTLVVAGTSQITGALATQAGDSLIVQGNGTVGAATLAVSGGSWTNAGAIVLTDSVSTYGATLMMPAGTLTNAPGATIEAALGANGNRSLNAALNNQGTVTVATAPAAKLTIAPPGGTASANSGTIAVNSGTLQVTLTGASPAFTNAGAGTIQLAGGDLALSQPSGATPGVITNDGAIAISSGHTLTVTGGKLTVNTGATISGAGTLALSGDTASVALKFATGSTRLTLTNSAWLGSDTLTNSGGVTLGLQNSTIGGPFANLGTLLATGTSRITGGFTTQIGDSIIVQGNGTVGAGALTVSGGAWTNNGAILLTDVTSTYGANLTVPSGTLTNPSGSTIEAALGANGNRALNATVDNQGAIVVATAAAGKLTIAPPAGGTLSNNGTIIVNSGALQLTLTGASPGVNNQAGGTIHLAGGDLTLNQPSGSTPGVLTNDGSLVIPTGRRFTVTGGKLTVNGGASITGAGTLALSGDTASVALKFTTGATLLSLASSAWLGADTLTNAAGVTLNVQNSTIGGPFVNAGTLLATGTSQLTGDVTTVAGDSIIVQGNGSTGAATLSVTGLNGLANNGAVLLTDVTSTYGATLTVSNGPLTNVAGATIEAAPGAGGDRTINATLDNQGTITAAPVAGRKLTIAPPAGGELNNSGTITVDGGGTLQATMTGTNPFASNSGTIDLKGGDFTLSQPSGAPEGTLATPGTLTIGAGRTFTVAGGVFQVPLNATIAGGGTLLLAADSAAVAPDFNTSAVRLTLQNSIWLGTGVLTNAAGVTLDLQTSEIAGQFLNEGTLLATGTSVISQPVGTAAASLIQVVGNGTSGAATLHVSASGGLVNRGTIDLTDVGSTYGATLVVDSGLTNLAGAKLEALAGAGGARTLTAALIDSAGATVSVARTLTLNPPTAGHVNYGTIQLVGGDLNVVFSSGRPGFGNFGLIDVGTNTMKVSGVTGPLGSFVNQSGGTLQGSGTFDVAGTSFISNGTVTVGGSPGVLKWVGPYTQGPSPSVFNVEIGGSPANAGIDFDQFQGSDNVSLQGGTLNATVLGTQPKGTYVIIALPAGKLFSGDFQTKNLPGNPLSGVCTTAISAGGNQYEIVCP